MSRFTLIERRARAATTPQEGLDRREAIAWMSAGAGLAMAGCGKPDEKIVPLARAAAAARPGEIVRYATSLPLGGIGRAAVVITRDGRPLKVEGDPRHSSSGGATDVFMEADVLGLYDPGRSRGVEGPSGPADWSEFAQAWAPELVRLKERGGEGFSLVTPRITSPTELRLIAEMQALLPRMKWRRFESINDDAADAGAERAFGRALDVRLDLSGLGALLCLDADPLGPGPASLAHARAFSAARDPKRGERMLRLYAAEPGWSLMGANADHRLPAHPLALGEIAIAVARALGADLRPVTLSDAERRFAEAAAVDLMERGGAVLVGRTLSPDVHALAHWINARLSAPVKTIPRIDPHPQSHGQSFHDLRADLEAGRIDTLVTLGGDPVGGPGGAQLAPLVAKTRLHMAASERLDATSALARWRLALTHALESWGDLKDWQGGASLMQPMIRPLHDGRTAAAILALLMLKTTTDARALVLETWSTAGGDAEARLQDALSSGVIDPAPAPAPAPAVSAVPAMPPLPATRPAWALQLRPDPTLYDGRYAENAWLQECPKPLSHETWGAALAISPDDAQRLGVKSGDHLALEGLPAPAAVRVTPGQAEGVLTGYLGGGRQSAGPIASGVGYNLAALAPDVSASVLELRAPRKASAKGAPPAFSQTVRLTGDTASLAPSVAAADLGRVRQRPEPALSLHPTAASSSPAWAMVIDTAACIGCSACVVACQAENNVPVVGPKEVAAGRDMHWLRIDTYDVGDAAEPRPLFQPVPCMQCEHAPCEPVCPVEASVHDHEGLNVQVYNRCIGTRFCEANCPYKVRRFNFHGYSQEQAYENLGDESYFGQRNPEVTVRARGVMEKCTYCVQRISSARRDAEREGRALREGEVKTACQSACPTSAIHFGDQANAASDVSREKRNARHYALLAELGTRPRTTYLSRVRNPSPRLAT